MAMSSRLLLPLPALALLLVACALEAPAPAPVPGPVTTALPVDTVARAVDAVAAEQTEADAEVEAALDAFRDADTTLAWVRSTLRIDAGLEQAEVAREGIAQVSAEALRTELREVAEAVDDARAELARVRAAVEDDWTARYLDAQDAVLMAVREHAATGDALAQVLGHARAHYLDALDVVVEQAAVRDRYRSVEEAVGAMQVALGPHLADLTASQDRIARYRREHVQQAAEVNRASADAATIYDARPAG